MVPHNKLCGLVSHSSVGVETIRQSEYQTTRARRVAPQIKGTTNLLGSGLNGHAIFTNFALTLPRNDKLLRNFLHAPVGDSVTRSPRSFALFRMLRISCSRYFS